MMLSVYVDVKRLWCTQCGIACAAHFRTMEAKAFVAKCDWTTLWSPYAFRSIRERFPDVNGSAIVSVMEACIVITRMLAWL